MAITNAKDWIKAQEVELPSGKWALLKSPDVLDMLTKSGTIQELLVGFARSDPERADADKNGKDNTLDELQMVAQLAPLLNQIVMAAFVEPRVAEQADYDNNVLSLADISLTDKMFVFSREMGKANQLAPLSETALPAGNSIKHAKRPTHLPVR
jgi:hypothetical protein